MPIYMQVEGIKGPVTTAPYAGWIALDSFTVGMDRHDADDPGHNRKADQPSPVGVRAQKNVDRSGPELFRILGENKGRKVVAEMLQEDGKTVYLRFTLEAAVVVSFATIKGPHSPRAMEVVTFDARSIRREVVAEPATGKP